MKTLTLNRYRQLSQLSRIAPVAYRKIITTIDGYPELDHNQRIADALKAALVAPPESQPPGPDQPVYDLVICAKKYGFGATTTQAAPILWYKKAGESGKSQPGMTMAAIAAKGWLDGYTLVATEVQTGKMVYRYKKS